MSNQFISKHNDENILLSPTANAHIILIHENQFDLDTAIATYINEGLKRGQLCIYASVSLANEGYLDDFSKRITNYKENLEEGNLILIDMRPHYVNAMAGNLESYDELKEAITNIVSKDKNRSDKFIRIIGDCTTLLLQNKHLEQCIQVEQWCNQNPLEGSILCAYPKSLLNQFPINVCLSRLFNCHDIIVNSSGKLIPKFARQYMFEFKS
ncbi:MEDS domain-containing protein [Candidatus Nitrosocosmicus agrestis]|jgi:hypothetical protein|uniref:MEDS domain-containing protein n=1 Tax=Candidatus Nitrosocosmicus agrestis TaxID=2563600 RepID=UPI00122E9EC8|nr:MEDS domain-containing protein [Candidatus Nitrosocosmicus sp. SS]KAA2282974.1 hypothetical protein F1Z66_04745 [Candidatus Nitrosocosmicus sp. SS]KAF0869177.1 hypothetical protein E5N71_07025 [Candidatus Nitrosocosmicus sp. SS]